MSAPKTTVERAFELARGGKCNSISDIRRHLYKEHFEGVDAHTGGTAITKQLRAAIAAGKRGEH